MSLTAQLSKFIRKLLNIKAARWAALLSFNKSLQFHMAFAKGNQSKLRKRVRFVPLKKNKENTFL